MARRMASHVAMMAGVSTIAAEAYTAPGSENRHKTAPVGNTRKKRR